MTTINLTQRDIDALSRVANSEVGHFGKYGSDERDRAVAAVVDTILNRVASPSYPNTVEGVVNQRGQFSAVSGSRKAVGSWDKLPSAKPTVTSFVSQHVTNRAQGVPSTVGGHLHFANPSVVLGKFSEASKATKKWVSDLAKNPIGIFGNQKRGDFHVHGTAPGSTPAGPYHVALNGVSPTQPLPNAKPTTPAPLGWVETAELPAVPPPRAGQSFPQQGQMTPLVSTAPGALPAMPTPTNASVLAARAAQAVPQPTPAVMMADMAPNLTGMARPTPRAPGSLPAATMASQAPIALDPRDVTATGRRGASATALGELGVVPTPGAQRPSPRPQYDPKAAPQPAAAPLPQSRPSLAAMTPGRPTPRSQGLQKAMAAPMPQVRPDRAIPTPDMLVPQERFSAIPQSRPTPTAMATAANDRIASAFALAEDPDFQAEVDRYLAGSAPVPAPTPRARIDQAFADASTLQLAKPEPTPRTPSEISTALTGAPSPNAVMQPAPNPTIAAPTPQARPTMSAQDFTSLPALESIYASPVPTPTTMMGKSDLVSMSTNDMPGPDAVPTPTMMKDETPQHRGLRSAPGKVDLARALAGGAFLGPIGAVGGVVIPRAFNSIRNQRQLEGSGPTTVSRNGLGQGAVEGAIAAGRAASGGPGYNSQAARNAFNQTAGSSDAQTQAQFDWADAKARGSYDANGNYQGSGGAGAGGGLSQETRDAIDAAEARGEGGLW